VTCDQIAKTRVLNSALLSAYSVQKLRRHLSTNVVPTNNKK